MTTINTYLNFNGNCEEAFEFYRSVFGGQFAFVGRFGQMPSLEQGSSVPPQDADKIMHISLPISNETILMGSDTISSHSPEYRAGNNFSISINPASRKEADRLFTGLSQGGTITMPLQQTFWDAYFGIFTDKFGINWMVNYHEPTQS